MTMTFVRSVEETETSDETRNKGRVSSRVEGNGKRNLQPWLFVISPADFPVKYIPFLLNAEFPEKNSLQQTQFLLKFKFF